MPVPKRKPQYTCDQFTAVRRYQLALAFSPDGSEVAYSTNVSGQFNLWRQSSDGGYPHQLTFYSEQCVRQIAWSPEGKTILYTADKHGDEFHQLYVIPARGGQPQQITDAPKVQHYIAGQAWSPNGRYMAYCGNDRVPTDMDVLIRDARTGEVRRALSGDRFYVPVSWSPKGQHLTVIDFKSNTNSDIHLLSLRGGAAENLTPHEGDVRYLPGPWAPDGAGFYLATDEGKEYVGLAFCDLKSREYEWLETPRWDVEQLALSEDGRTLAWSVNENGYSRVYVRNLKTRKLLKLPKLPQGVIALLELSRDGRKLGLLLTRSEHAAEIYVVDLVKKKLTQLTHSMLGGINERDLIRPKPIHYPTHDGRKIPAFLYRPKGSGKFPVILSIHGGPEAQERPAYQYSGMYQYWLNQGIGVLAPNIRGSTGYGKTYQKMIRRDWGGAELQDLEYAVKYLHSLGWVDVKRIGVFGGSFGGFATLSCVSRLPDYWAAAVDIVGPSNLVTFTKAVPPTWRRFMKEWVGDPETDAEFLMSRSPITYVDQIKAPLFIIQGAKDPRVVKPESDQIVERLRARGVEVKYDVYEDEGHGFTKRENELKAWRDAAGFFDQHLL